ncbi:MAG: hypothetical protein RQ731_00030 [Anaerosomatales bacterium]|nr:hypothetical protein [Anaerosomatales bacterium]MDT8433140.1 hypothetical protein [Anaerosomatales bacterium]
MCPFRCTRDTGDLLLWNLVRDVFCAIAVGWLLYIVHQIAGGVLLGARITALREVGEAYTPEEREVLIHSIKRGSLGR